MIWWLAGKGWVLSKSGSVVCFPYSPLDQNGTVGKYLKGLFEGWVGVG